MSEKDLIDEILEDIEEEDKIDDTEEGKLPAKKQENEIDVTEAESIANELVSMTMDDRKVADTLFQLFYSELANGRDKTTASKETIARALEARISAGKNMIELLKIMKGGDNKNSIGMFFGDSMSSSKVGIDLKNVAEELEKES